MDKQSLTERGQSDAVCVYPRESLFQLRRWQEDNLSTNFSTNGMKNMILNMICYKSLTLFLTKRKKLSLE